MLNYQISYLWSADYAFFFFSGLHELQCADTPVYNYPLVNTTGTAEVVYGGYSGYEGLGAVTAFSPHPSIENAPLYFFGSDYSYAELKLGEEAALTNDWSFNMFVYSIAPHTGTIFDFVYDGNTQLPDSLFSSRVKLQLNGSHIILEMLGPSGEDYGSAVVGTIFTAEMWIPLGLVHDKSNGDVTLQTLGIKFYESKDFQDNSNHIKLPQPAKIKIAGAFNESSPFKGSVVCFTVYDKTVSTLSFVSTYIDCGPSNWPVTPPEIGKLNQVFFSFFFLYFVFFFVILFLCSFNNQVNK